MARPVTVFTIGHSTRSLDEFLAILKSFSIELVVDVRTLPGSMRCPQFNGETLVPALAESGIGYVHQKGLGGLRRARKDSTNTAWRNASFRGYADYMQTPEFAANLAELVELAHEKRLALMCAEAVPWRCHRSLIGDALLTHGFAVQDIFSQGKSKPHELTPFAKLDGQRVHYPGD